MPTSPFPGQPVPVEILPPVPPDAHPGRAVATDKPPFDGLSTFYHPASGVVILALDWLLFGTDLVTGFLALPLMCVVGFLFTFGAVLAIQRQWAKNSLPQAAGKAFLGAFLVGLPFPITGTMLGAAILVLSGLPHHPVEAVKRLASRAEAR